MKELISILREVTLFKDLEEPQLRCIANNAIPISLKKGSFVFHKGDLYKGLYLIIKGRVKSVFFSPEGKEHVMRIIGTGESFADSGMFINAPHPTSVQALNKTQALLISKQCIFQCLDEDPSFAISILSGLNQRFRDYSVQREAITLHSSVQRVIGYLLKDGDTSQPDLNKRFVVLPANKSTIASHLNITPETFSRVLSNLCSEGSISQSGSVIKIESMEKLAVQLY